MKRSGAVAWLLAAVAVVGAFTTAGCTTGAAPSRVPAAQHDRPRPLTDAEAAWISAAGQRLVRRCMESEGFRYWEAERPTAEESRSLGYVSDDVAWARTYGYGGRIRAELERARRTNPNGAYRRSLPPDRRTAYDQALDQGDVRVLTARAPSGGTVRKRVGGCVAEAERRLYGDPEAYFRAEKTATGLQPLYVPHLMRDRQLQSALAAWARCMTRQGHPYRTPDEARAAAERSIATAAPGEEFATERTIAVADASCARTTRLRSVGEQREKHYVDELRDRYGEALDTYARIRLRALARAAEIVPPSP